MKLTTARLMLFCMWFFITGKLFAGDLIYDGTSDAADALTAAIMKSVGDAFALNAKGIDLLADQKYDAALELFLQASQKMPEYTDALNNEAVVYFRKGSIGKAQERWEEIVRKDPSYAVAWYNLGNCAFFDKRFDDARVSLTKAIGINKQFIEAYVLKGRIELTQKKYRPAHEWFLKAYTLDPKNRDAWSSFAYVNILTGDTARALSILSNHSDDVGALELKGSILAAQGKNSEALRVLGNAFGKGSSPSVSLTLAQIQLNTGNCRDAISSIVLYLGRVDHPVVDAFLVAGTAMVSCDEISHALTTVQDGLKLFPEDQQLLLLAGKVAFCAGNTTDADRYLSRLADTTTDAELLYIRGQIARDAGAFVTAERRIKAALALEKRADFYDALGMVLYKKGNKNEALAQFTRALALDPAHGMALLHKALLDSTQAPTAAAVAKAQLNAEQCAPDCAQAALRLSTLYYRLHDLNKAIDALEKVQIDQVRTPILKKNVLRALSAYYLETGSIVKSIAPLEKLSRLEGAQEHDIIALMDAYSRNGLYQKALDEAVRWQSKGLRHEARFWYVYGYAEFMLNNLDKAAELFARTLTTNPEHVAAQGMLGLVRARQGRTSEAATLWKANLTKDADNPVILKNLGSSELAQGKYKSALSYFESSLKKDPADQSIFLAMGVAHEGLGNRDKAMEQYRSALSSSIRLAAAYNLYLLAGLMDKKLIRQEMSLLISKEFAGSSEASRIAADVYLEQGDTSRALQTLESIRSKNQDDSVALARLAAERGSRGTMEKYLAGLQNDQNTPVNSIRARCCFIEKDFECAYRWYVMGTDTSFEGRFNGALAAYESKRAAQALDICDSIEPHADALSRPLVWKLAGNAALQSREWDAAKKWFKKLTAREASVGTHAFNLAVVYYNTGNMDSSWHWYKLAQRLDSRLVSNDIEARHRVSNLDTTVSAAIAYDSLDVLYNNAVVLQGKGKVTQAEKVYKKILLADSTYARAWNNLGAILAAQGELNEAENAYRKAILLRPDDLPEAFANCAAVQFANNDRSGAMETVRKGLAIHPDDPSIISVQKQIGK